MKTGRILAAWLLAVTGLAAGARAQDYPPGPNGEAAPRSEGPAPDVARISLIHGDVSTQRGDTGDWAVTSINAPLVRGDQVATGDKSRTEIQLDYANILRLAAQSQVKIADLTRTRIQVQVAQGYANYTMFKGGEADVEIDTPNVAVRPLKHGRYRVQVNSGSETDVIVRDGEAEITTPQGSTRVKEGEMISIRGTDQPEYRVSNAPGKDDWDRWNKDRDNTIKDAQSWGRTNRYYTGANDLDGYGRWVYVPGYGNVWQPYQQGGWAPYQTGRWVWEPYYGWTWVSYEPWGWAPYHYGRWFYYGSNWCWWPGPVRIGYRPLWSPAFVFFVGFGHRAGFGFGSIGWFPVGPHDPFYPWYGRGFNRVNVVNITNINVINVNRGRFIAPLAVRGRQPYFSNARLALTNPRVRGSITSVNASDFGRGGNSGWRHGVDEHELRQSRVMTANLPVVPSRESLHAGSGAVPSGIQTRNNERFYTRHQPPAGPESFHEQRERVLRAVGPEAAGAQAEARGGFHSGLAQADRRDNGRNAAGNANGGVNVRTGNAEVPRTDGSSNGRTTPGRSTGPQAPGENNQGNVSSDNGRGMDTRSDSRDNRSRGGWSKFGPPGGRSNGGEPTNRNSTPAPRSNDGVRGSRTDSTPKSHTGGGSPNWQKFPTAGDRPASGERATQPSDRGAQTPPTRTTQEERGGWQRFPQNSDRGSRSNDQPASRNDTINFNERSVGGGKPPLELHRPIVTPRQPEVRNEQRNAPPAHTPDVQNEPRSSPSPQGGEPRYSPREQRGEPRYSPSPQRSESRRESRSGSGSSHSGGGDRGSHESKSSSGHRQR
jgi:hypothetical protein